MKIRVINRNKRRFTKVGEYVIYNDILLKCEKYDSKHIKRCHGCFFFKESGYYERCSSPNDSCFSCVSPDTIFVLK